MSAPRRIRLGMVGGGEGSFIGAAHRVAARLDDAFELVAGALSSQPERARSSGAALRLAADRCYPSYAEMAAREPLRPDGIDAVVIVTPNHLHHAVAKHFLAQGIDVICDKPLAISLAEADELVALTRQHGRLFMVTHTYSGYPMVRHARELVGSGALGEIRIVQVEYAQDWLAEPLERSGHKQAAWRTDPAQAGPAGALGDIGSHAFHLASFVSGLETEALMAELATFVPGRRLDDHVQVMLRFAGGARGLLWASQVATGEHNALRLRVYGTRASIEFNQEEPETLWLRQAAQPAQLVRRGAIAPGGAAALAARLPAGHPEGYFEAFAQLYRDFAQLWQARALGQPPPQCAASVPQVEAGRHGVAFIDAVLRSHRSGQQWVALA